MKILFNKKVVLACVVLVFESFTFLAAQTFKTTYLITYQTDSNSVKSKRQEKAILFIDDRYSYYATENYLRKDSVMRLVIAGKLTPYEVMGSKSNQTSTKYEQFIRKDFQKNVTVYEKINWDNYKYEITDGLTWAIADTTAKMNGYDCSKATTHFAGRDYEVWFTKDIPISDGPYVFCGLPGLIVKLYDTKSYHTFELIGFGSFDGKVVTSISKDPEKIILTTRENVFKIREEDRTDPIGSFDRSFGARTHMTPEDKEYMRKRVAANNNPLELRLD